MGNHDHDPATHEYTTSADLTKPKPSWEPKPAWGSVEPAKPTTTEPIFGSVKTVAELREVAADLKEMNRQYEKSREQLKGVLVAQIEALMMDLESLGVYYRIEEIHDPEEVKSRGETPVPATPPPVPATPVPTPPLGRRTKRCARCGREGHNIKTCTYSNPRLKIK